MFSSIVVYVSQPAVHCKPTTRAQNNLPVEHCTCGYWMLRNMSCPEYEGSEYARVVRAFARITHAPSLIFSCINSLNNSLSRTVDFISNTAQHITYETVKARMILGTRFHKLPTIIQTFSVPLNNLFHISCFKAFNIHVKWV